jgi:hypothetical protein
LIRCRNCDTLAYQPSGACAHHRPRLTSQYQEKAVSTMCYSPCFIQATRAAFAPQQLLQCRTCGSQAFHVLDCCRNPDYVRVPTSQFVHRLTHWLSRVKTSVYAWRSQRRQGLDRPASPQALDAWETRPVIVVNPGRTRTSEDLGAREEAPHQGHEAVSARR